MEGDERLLASCLVHDVQFNSPSDEFATEQTLLPTTSVDMCCPSNDDLFATSEVFITNNGEGVLCLSFEDTLTGDLHLSLPENVLHEVTDQIYLQNSTATEDSLMTSCTTGTATNSLEEHSTTPDSYTQEARLAMRPNGQDIQLKAVKVPTPIVKSQSSSDSIQKKRGGWPKGRKRKPEILLKPPKAPATGYVLYLNEKRKLYQNIPFPTVTKLLGHEWSRMSIGDKSIYLDQAEQEKKRYKQELLLYKKSDAYQSYLTEQREKRIKNNGITGSDVGTKDETEDEDNGELHCQTCDQWFNTLHNKKEHLYGRQHFQNISMNFKKMYRQKVDNFSFCSDDGNICCDENRIAYVNDVMTDLMEISADREREIVILRQRVATLRAENSEFVKEITDLSSRQMAANVTWKAVQQNKTELENQVSNLLALPALLLKNLCLTNNNLPPESSSLTIPFYHNVLSSIPVLTDDLEILSNVDVL